MNTANDQLVGLLGDKIVITRPKTVMTKGEALLHAAWIVALADDGEENGQFEDILDAVQRI